MARHVAELILDIVRFVDDYQPGIVACELVDAEGRRHTFIGKLPYFSHAELDANSTYPQPGTVRCTVLSEHTDAPGRELVCISTDEPYGVESIEGLGGFVVLRAQVAAIPS